MKSWIKPNGDLIVWAETLDPFEFLNIKHCNFTNNDYVIIDKSVVNSEVLELCNYDELKLHLDIEWRYLKTN